MEIPENIINDSSQIHKRPFTTQEDQILFASVIKNGAKNWNLISTQLNNRTPKQCRERWHNHLDPFINKGPWTLNEDKILAVKQKELGNKWAEISKFLPGRTDTLIKNRWNTSIKTRSDELLKENYKNQIDSERIQNWLENISHKRFQSSLSNILDIPPLIITKIENLKSK